MLRIISISAMQIIEFCPYRWLAETPLTKDHGFITQGLHFVGL